MSERAHVLVHGATGYTGKLVCEALVRKKLPFAIGGRSRDKLAALAQSLGVDVELCVLDIKDPESLRRAIEGRKIVSACAGPYIQVGEPVLASCARLGVHYVDLTGEQRFVADAVSRYCATAEAHGACIVPSMAYEIAPADWGAHVAAERLGVAPETIAIGYFTRTDGGYGGATTRGTKLSALGMIADGDSRQFVDGALVRERTAERVRRFTLLNGKEVTAVSFPSPEAVVVGSHTGARTVRTFMGMGKRPANALHLLRAVAPTVVRAVAPLLERSIRKAPDGPPREARERTTFEIVVVATCGNKSETVHVRGKNPYGLTAEIHAFAVEQAVLGAVSARGVVAPSVAYPANQAFAALSYTGLTID
jgi:Uncharacterized conserved protein